MAPLIGAVGKGTFDSIADIAKGPLCSRTSKIAKSAVTMHCRASPPSRNSASERYARVRTITSFAVEKSAVCRMSLLNPAQGMGFGIEHRLIQVQELVGSEEQVQVLERLGQEVAGHHIPLLLGHDVLQGGVAGVGPAVGHQALEERPSHLEIPPIVRPPMEIVGGLNDLRPQRVAGV